MVVHVPFVDQLPVKPVNLAIKKMKNSGSSQSRKLTIQDIIGWFMGGLGWFLCGLGWFWRFWVVSDGSVF